MDRAGPGSLNRMSREEGGARAYPRLAGAAAAASSCGFVVLLLAERLGARLAECWMQPDAKAADAPPKCDGHVGWRSPRFGF